MYSVSVLVIWLQLLVPSLFGVCITAPQLTGDAGVSCVLGDKEASECQGSKTDSCCSLQQSEDCDASDEVTNDGRVRAVDLAPLPLVDGSLSSDSAPRVALGCDVSPSAVTLQSKHVRLQV